MTGTGAAATIKGGMIVTATGLVFATAADCKIHVYDSATGRQLWEAPLGGVTSGAPSMYELGGRQYLLVTASNAPANNATRALADANLPPLQGPKGIVAYALPRR